MPVSSSWLQFVCNVRCGASVLKKVPCLFIWNTYELIGIASIVEYKHFLNKYYQYLHIDKR